MTLCDALTSQLSAMAPGAASVGTDESKGGEASDAPANTVSNDGLVLMKKEVQDDYGSLGGGKKKKKGRKGKRGGQKSADVRARCSAVLVCVVILLCAMVNDALTTPLRLHGAVY